MIDYESFPVVGLRSNPKLCYQAEYYHQWILVKCGLRCGCIGEAKIEDGKFDHALKLAKEEAIKKHDKMMKIAKRNRIRARNPGAMPVRPREVRRAAGGFVWSASARGSRNDTWIVN